MVDIDPTDHMALLEDSHTDDLMIYALNASIENLADPLVPIMVTRRQRTQRRTPLNEFRGTGKSRLAAVRDVFDQVKEHLSQLTGPLLLTRRDRVDLEQVDIGAYQATLWLAFEPDLWLGVKPVRVEGTIDGGR